ncbi:MULTISPECIES: DUF6355 family natural product biosynthesis protein [Actinosynnema]|uniref:DUF6355 family natural product biosynthesis protein n=1 Tax=Actinosynnema TaxID=40566 RepID=UPI0020A4655A|nr:DUF6355 family natural product biosynthesis protein [Actinosynnema pretiosum]MCP2097516.1 hypothetical protein [Actinosynnema pretiosum]
MTRTFILRLLGVFGLALGLSLAVTAGSASAQIAMGGPYKPAGSTTGSQSEVQSAQPVAWQAPYATPGAQIQNAGSPGSQIQAQAGAPLPGSRIQSESGLAVPARAQAGTDGVTAQACGWYAPNVNSYYIHCGSGRISINVEFWWGAGATRSICVWPGKSNLSAHPALQGGLITYAYYNGRGC